MTLTAEHWASETSHSKRVKKRAQGQLWSPRRKRIATRTVIYSVENGQLVVTQ